MCINIMEDGMDTRTTHVISDYLRKTRKPGPKLNFKLRVSLKQCGGGGAAVKTAVRKYLPREQERAELDELCWKDGDKGDGRRSGCEESPAAACARRHPAGSMAPENTTQYLMTRVYEDMTSDGAQSAALDESRSPRSATADPDVEFESCLAFQQRDFEEAFGFDCGALDAARPVGGAPGSCKEPSKTAPVCSARAAQDCGIQVHPCQDTGYEVMRTAGESMEVALHVPDAR